MAAVSLGQQIGGRYRLDALLARGGMGAVYRATDTRLGRSVAVKVLLSELAVDTTEVTRFEREASAVASLHHPGIVQVLDVGRDGDTPYLVMEHVQGRTLSDILGKEGKLDPVRACDLVEQALFAISVAHGAGIIHRDLKPANLMIVPTGGREMVKVLDFGIAQLKSGTAYTRLTQTGALVGTPMFMAPEQVRGEVCDARTDVYAMGVVLWCVLTGRKPFAAKEMGEVVLKVLGETPARADRVEPSVPAPMAAAAEVAMQKAPELRFATASAFASALADLRVRASMTPPMPSAPQPAPVQRTMPPVVAPRASMPAQQPPTVAPSSGMQSLGPDPRTSMPPQLTSPAPIFTAPAPRSASTLVVGPMPAQLSPAPVPPQFSPAPMQPQLSPAASGPYAALPPAPAPAPAGGVSTRAIALAALGLVVLLCISVCLVGGYVLRTMSAVSAPVAGAAPAPSPGWSVPSIGAPNGGWASGSTCDQAVHCCEVLAGTASSCGALRGLERYPTGEATCANALASYRDTLARLGRTCD